MMKYLRTYPPGMQLLLFLLMTFTLFSLALVLIGVLIPKVYGVPTESLQNISEKTAPLFIHLALLAQGIGSLMIFAAPSLTFAYLAHPEPRRYLGLRGPKKPIHLLLGVLVMLGAMPTFVALQVLMSHINFGPDVQKSQEAAEAVFRAYLTMPTFADFLRTTLIIAVVPAIGEELFFRGIIMRFTHKSSKKMIVAVMFSAGMFAFVHASYYGLPSIFLAGVLLAVIYNLTGSLWCGILAHMFFNGSQILLSYLGNTNTKLAALVDENSVQWGMVAGGLALFAIAFYALWKTRTPLASNWSNDFDQPQNISADEDSAIFN